MAHDRMAIDCRPTCRCLKAFVDKLQVLVGTWTGISKLIGVYFQNTPLSTFTPARVYIDKQSTGCSNKIAQSLPCN